ncbi:MAG: biopolymer transporter Tol [Opitutales bacterium]
MPANLLLFLLPVLFGLGGLSANVIDIGDAVRRGDKMLPIAVESSDRNLTEIGRRAFNLHGAFRVSSADDAAIVLKLRQAGSNSVFMRVDSRGSEIRELRGKVTGNGIRDAVLRACDKTVEASLDLNGFFAGKLAFVGKQRGNSELYVSDLLFSRVRPLTADRALVTGPSWSPDGKQLLFTTYFKTGSPDIYKIDLSSGNRELIAGFKGTNSGAAFSPDGRLIAMIMSGTGNAELYVSDPSGRNIQRLTANDSLEAAPSWSPDGSRLVYVSDAPGRPQLFQVKSEGGSPRRIPTNISRYCAEPDWNPVDPERIAFTVAVGSGFQIAVYEASERDSKIVTSVADSAVEPVWLNDGRHLVFTQRQHGRTRLMLLDTETETVKPLHKPEFGDASSAGFVYPGR